MNCWESSRPSDYEVAMIHVDSFDLPAVVKNRPRRCQVVYFISVPVCPPCFK